MATADGLLRSCADNTYDTMHFQSSLLRLPIPKLEDTLERCASWLTHSLARFLHVSTHKRPYTHKLHTAT